ncbi:Dual specificity phosphatase, catalytic domain containing protein [Trichomonas vaginalis G3]|uniref:protein-tyrosine-phosphatase n=1 Tax=Trichomonas vaginalis (strain ATCC PRA-98 / G3) TaxID=412133 RepID=A2DUX9_TRIV3|nr:protein tyrosine/serine/threonine phosphatase protein [Trichomonas vaginalis G3]EAY15864.1 Dual specificity phosphatase, catalytic domain containing protein [Trichomonas vaginalis G3]KAI5524967.1 protein tyrosine/serine/threonine phosphatase protein [Trichomonas vaginalis G3]|eukprot:XP_001328087.1 Dual specificity phosphatase, catalytic domain containing protein [Trichomonas vaginalis G3]
MGLGLSIESVKGTDSNGPKALILLLYEKQSFKPISFTDFIENPLAFSSNPLVILEPIQGEHAKMETSMIRGKSYADTIRIFHQHFRPQFFKVPGQYIWVITPNKLPKSVNSEIAASLKTAQLENYSSTKCVDPQTVFLDLGQINSLTMALKPPQQTQFIRASSPIRTAGHFCGTSKLISRRSHNTNFNGTFKLPSLPTLDGFKEDSPPDDMNKIIEGLYIGDERAAANKQMLLDNNITHIVNLSGQTAQNYFPDTFKYFSLEMIDNDFEEIPPKFWEAIKFVQKSLQSGGTVLVHCRRGISRSAALVAAFLNEDRAMPIDSAIALIKQNRSNININQGFLDQLYMKETKRRKSKPRLIIPGKL